MAQLSVQRHPRPTSLTEDYEYRIYDSHHPQTLVFSELAPCPVVVMSRHEGFEWNDELFVSAFRRGEGFESRKSKDRHEREARIANACNVHRHGRNLDNIQEQAGSSQVNASLLSRQQHEQDGVIEIHLTEADCDIWP